MKIVSVFLLLTVSCQHIHADYVNDLQVDYVRDFASRAIGDKLKTMLENFKKIMKTGNSTLGLPILDPFEVENEKLNIELEQIILNGIISNLLVDDLSDYVVQNADFKIAKWNFTIDLLWNNIKGKTEYDVDAKVLNSIPIYGAGDVNFEVSGFRFATQAKLKINYKTKKISLVNLSATIISLDDIKVNITGLYNNDEISQMVSDIIADAAPGALKDFQKEVTAIVNKILLKVGNLILDKISLDDIIGVIS